MTKKEYVERNIGITFDFVRHLIDHPDMIESIPDSAELDFIDKDMSFKVKRHVKGKRVVKYKVEHIFEPIKG